MMALGLQRGAQRLGGTAAPHLPPVCPFTPKVGTLTDAPSTQTPKDAQMRSCAKMCEKREEP